MTAGAGWRNELITRTVPYDLPNVIKTFGALHKNVLQPADDDAGRGRPGALLVRVRDVYSDTSTEDLLVRVQYCTRVGYSVGYSYLQGLKTLFNTSTVALRVVLPAPPPPPPPPPPIYI